MNELKRKINEIIKNNNIDWVNAIKNAGNDGIDLGSMISVNAEYSEQISTAFIEYEERLKNKNKKSRWG